jgi:putative transposase
MFMYLLAEATEQHGTLVHAVVFMSNHVHIVVTDTRGNLPRFMHLLFGQIAKAVNAWTGHIEAVFSTARRPNVLELVTEDAMVKEIAYLLANPSKAGLVDNAADWPGFITTAEDLAKGATYIGGVGDNPYLKRRKLKTRELQIVPIPKVANAQVFAEHVATEQRQLEEHARQKRKADGVGVLGADAVRRQHWRKMPKTGAKLFGLIPTIAAARRQARIVALVALKEFRRKYQAALAAYRSGRKHVEFPYGTWQMRHVYAAKVAEPLPAAA